jgi:hypothetical protein
LLLWLCDLRLCTGLGPMDPSDPDGGFMSSNIKHYFRA